MNDNSLQPSAPTPACPSCGVKLEVTPQRKKKCPSCGQYIYVRTRPSDRQRVLVNEEEANRIDDEWQKINVMQRMAEYGISKQVFDRIKEQLTQRFGVEPDFNNVIFVFLTERLVYATEKSDWATIQSSSFEMAVILHDWDMDCFKWLQESKSAELKGYKAMGVQKVDILTCGEDSCDRCRALHMKRFTVSKALELMPIPVKDCENDGWCRCDYLPVVL